jgi:hypothetical protein
MKWTEPVAHTRENKNVYTFPAGKAESKNNLQELGVDEKIILKEFNKKDWGTWTGLILLRIGTSCVFLLAW